LDQLTEKIVAEIRNHGAIPFSRFMELALYCPVFGYYEAEGDKIGRGGDYYTSVSTGSLFGELLACQFAEWLNTENPRLIEAGAHNGELATDILVWLREHRPALFGRVKYVIVEPSERRRAWQRRTLAGFNTKVEWAETFEALAASAPSKPGPCADVIFSNELLDSMPVHRLGWNAAERTWFEWGVAWQSGRFVWERLARKRSQVEQLLEASGLMPVLANSPALTEVLPDGFIIELCPAALNWWRQAAGALRSGKLLTIDYGLPIQELLMPERTQGTLRAFYQHSVSADLLANPGRQDLTAQVNFSALQAVGEAAGLKTDSFLRQTQFLTAIAGRTWSGELAFGEWTAERKRQFQTLTHPEHLGRTFRVLVQSRDKA
jgi:SAM-dependent MidA family methyltransferase